MAVAVRARRRRRVMEERGRGLGIRGRGGRHFLTPGPWILTPVSGQAAHAGTALAMCHIIWSRAPWMSLLRALVKPAQQRPLAVCTAMVEVPGKLPPCQRFGVSLMLQPLAY